MQKSFLQLTTLAACAFAILSANAADNGNPSKAAAQTAAKAESAKLAQEPVTPAPGLSLPNLSVTNLNVPSLTLAKPTANLSATTAYDRFVALYTPNQVADGTGLNYPKTILEQFAGAKKAPAVGLFKYDFHADYAVHSELTGGEFANRLPAVDAITTSKQAYLYLPQWSVFQESSFDHNLEPLLKYNIDRNLVQQDKIFNAVKNTPKDGKYSNGKGFFSPVEPADQASLFETQALNSIYWDGLWSIPAVSDKFAQARDYAGRKAGELILENAPQYFLNVMRGYVKLLNDIENKEIVDAEYKRYLEVGLERAALNGAFIDADFSVAPPRQALEKLLQGRYGKSLPKLQALERDMRGYQGEIASLLDQATLGMAWTIYLPDASQLAGVADEIVDDLQAQAQFQYEQQQKYLKTHQQLPAGVEPIPATDGKVSGYVITPESPYLEILATADNRDLRKRIGQYVERINRDSFDTTAAIDKLVAARQERARMLGFTNAAELAVASNSALSVYQVHDFLATLETWSQTQALKNFQTLKQQAKGFFGIADLERWDVAYVLNKLAQENPTPALDASVRENVVSPGSLDRQYADYFPQAQVLKGMFSVAKDLFGIEIVQDRDAQVYAPGVTFYKVYDLLVDKDGKPIYEDEFDAKLEQEIAHNLVDDGKYDQASQPDQASAAVAALAPTAKASAKERRRARRLLGAFYLDNWANYAEVVQKRDAVSPAPAESKAVPAKRADADNRTDKPRKHPGAWMNTVVARFETDNFVRLPVALINADAQYHDFSEQNPEPTLTVSDVTTLFHEFGHALHLLLTKVKTPELGGTNVSMDVVEFPSQFFEQFAWTHQVLKRITRNVKTGKVMPASLRRKLLAQIAQNHDAAELHSKVLQAQVDFEIHRRAGFSAKTPEVNAKANPGLWASKFAPTDAPVPGVLQAESKLVAADGTVLTASPKADPTDAAQGVAKSVTVVEGAPDAEKLNTNDTVQQPLYGFNLPIFDKAPDVPAENGVSFTQVADEIFGASDLAFFGKKYPQAYFNSFEHVWLYGFGGNYYSYLWSEALALDAFAAFTTAAKKSGNLLDARLGRLFRQQVLESGNLTGMLDNFRNFRGRDFQLEAMLSHYQVALPTAAQASEFEQEQAQEYQELNEQIPDYENEEDRDEDAF